MKKSVFTCKISFRDEIRIISFQYEIQYNKKILTKIQNFGGISHYPHQEPLVEFQKLRRFISKYYIPISTRKKVKAWVIWRSRRDVGNERSLSLKNNCKLVIAPHYMTNKFQRLDRTSKHRVRSLFSNQFNKRYVERVSHQLTNRKSPDDLSLKLSNLKHLHGNHERIRKSRKNGGCEVRTKNLDKMRESFWW